MENTPDNNINYTDNASKMLKSTKKKKESNTNNKEEKKMKAQLTMKDSESQEDISYLNILELDHSVKFILLLNASKENRMH